MRLLLPFVRPATLLVLALLGAGPAGAEGAGWSEGRFADGARAVGLSVGHGLGLGLWGSDGEDAEQVEFVGLLPRYELGLGGAVADEHAYRGQLALVIEGELLVAYAPKGGFVGGVDLLLRYQLLSFGRLVPFVELGAGVAYLELDLDSQSDGLGFTPQGGFGVHWALGERTSLTASWRLHHLSNAGIGKDNVGINDSLVLVGFTYFLGSG
jgi:hypothetical protein